MTDPILSIIIPSYNSAGYLEATLYSLVNQAPGFEVIIIDDRSTDNSVQAATAAIARYNLNGRIIERSVTLPKGVASCRNLGIENARGGWISFLDSDDLFLPGKIAGTIDLIHQYGGACSAYFHTVRQFEDGSNKTLSTTNDAGPAGPADIFPELLKKNIITTSSVTIKKSLLNELGGFDINLHGVEDYMLWLRVAKMTKWLWSDNVWTDYRVRATSLMGGRKMTHYVTQSAQLLKSARSLGEFTNEELKKLEYSVFYLTLEYYALVSLNTGGWRDLLKGLAALVRIGKGKLALRIFRRHFKNLMLKKTHSYLKGANKTAR